MSQFIARKVLLHAGLFILILLCSKTVVCDDTCEGAGGSVKQGELWQCVKPVGPHNTSTSIRVTTRSQDANTEYPLLFVVRQQKSVLSWALPYVIQSMYLYNEVSHTLCPEDGLTSSAAHNISIDITTSSKKPVDFMLQITTVENFQLRANVPRKFVVSPSNPQYYLCAFPDGVDVILVKATSPSGICAVMSVQPAKCPVFDQHRNVEFEGQFQTMTKKAAITVQKSNFPSGYFFVVVLVQPSGHECTGTPIRSVPIQNKTFSLLAQEGKNRSKNITVTIDTILPVADYWKPIITTVAVLLSLYILTGCIMLAHHRRTAKYSDGNQEEQVHILADEESNTSVPFPRRQGAAAEYVYGTKGPSSTNSEARERSLQPASDVNDDSTDEDIDMLEDIYEEKEIYRTRTVICVADLSRKKPKTLDRKYKLYYWNLLTIAVFYALPVVQLVITYQAVLNMSGNEDMCYYNFLCAMPVGPISAFNNVFSNIGYVMLGVLYFLIVWRKDYIHRRAVASGSQKAKSYGIPKHFGLFYSLGIALVMEGVLSACYHVCPNYSNFQFDTSFMYIIAGLGILVLYQQRHPDVNANAYAAFAAFAAVIFIALMGVVFVSVYFYVIFAILHVITCLAVSAQIYYMGTLKLDLGMFKRAFIILRTELRNCAKPVYVDRMIVLVLGNVVNWSITIYGLSTMPKDFNSFLLAIFLVNLLLYVAFYTFMKLRSGERLIAPVILVIVVSLVVWGSALYFYFMGLTGWEKTPALSREQNAPCLLMDFYDGHDVWHILSSAALFLSFLLVLFLDEDLHDKERTKIPVF